MRLLTTLSIIIALLALNDVNASEWWNGWSPQNNNDRYQREPIPVTLATTKTEFKQLWYTPLNGPVMTPPTVYEHNVYVASYTGTFYCLQANNGMILWQKNISDFINNGHVYISRTSPLVYNDMIILGVFDISIAITVLGSGSYLIAFDRFTGALKWQNKVSSHPTSRLTNSPQLVNNVLFIGISAAEENYTPNPAYSCCTFQGSVIAVNADTGTLLWETKMIPDNNGTTTGYSGAAVWGSQFPVDYKRNRIYIATGNHYTLPAPIQKCLNETANLTLFSDPCEEPGAYGQALLALDMSTGIVRWSRIIGSVNAWTGACSSSPVPNNNCPPNPGRDIDFAQAPIFKLNWRHKLGGENRDQLFIGQKSGIAYGIDAETGTIIWSKKVSPTGIVGGIELGSAADDQCLYVGNNNVHRSNYTLLDGSTTTRASWSALDLVTGDIKWNTLDPTTDINQTSAHHALAVWDQLVLAQGGSQPNILGDVLKGCLYGMNKTNGQILYEWCIKNVPIGTGASVAKNTIYVGTGYKSQQTAEGGVVALQLPGYVESNVGTISAFFYPFCLFSLFLFF